MLLKNEKRLCKVVLSIYKRRLRTYLRRNTALDAKMLCRDYEERFYEVMEQAEMDKKRGRFTSYLNIYSGLCAYELTRKNGLSEETGVAAYDYMCAGLRKFVSFMYKTMDAFPYGYKAVRKSLYDDLVGDKAVCWDTEILQDDEKGFTYKITKCLYFDICAGCGYPEFCKVFCNHDWFAYGVLKKHAQFIRKSTIAEDGTCCYDSILKVK